MKYHTQGDPSPSKILSFEIQKMISGLRPKQVQQTKQKRIFKYKEIKEIWGEVSYFYQVFQQVTEKDVNH